MGIGAKTAKSAIMMAAAQLVAKFFDLILILILARILTPGDFGLVALSGSILLIANAVTEIPVIDALIRKDVIDDDDIDTAFTISLLRGGIVSIILMSVAIFSYDLLGDEKIGTILLVLSIVPLARGASSPKIVHRLREINYRAIATLNVAAKFISFTASLMVAIITNSYWAIVIGLVALPSLNTVATYIIAPYRPRLSLKKIGGIISFSGWITASKMVSTINQQFDKIFIGSFIGKDKLGIYSMAGDISTIATYAISTPISQPLYSGFSSIYHDKEKLKTSYLKSQQVIFAVVAPVGILLAVLSERFVYLFMGFAWIETVPLIQWLAPAIALQMLTVPVNSVALALGKSRMLFIRELISFTVRLPPTLLAAYFGGIVAAAAVRAVTSTIMVLYMMSVAKVLVDTAISRQIINCTRPLLSILTAAALVRLVSDSIGHYESYAVSLALIAGLSFAGLVIYFSILYLTWVVCKRPNGFETWVSEAINRKLKK